jgi:hypothetical protein
MINIPVEFANNADDTIWMVRYNFEPEGMEKNGALLNYSKGTQHVNADFPHAEKVSFFPSSSKPGPDLYSSSIEYRFSLRKCL